MRSNSLCINCITLSPASDSFQSFTSFLIPKTSTTTANYNLYFDLTTGVGGYTISAIDVNSVTPTLVSGTNVPFSTDTHLFDTNQVGGAETLNITVNPFTLNGCITVTDSASNVYQQNITSATTYTFSNLVINNSQPVYILCADNNC